MDSERGGPILPHESAKRVNEPGSGPLDTTGNPLAMRVVEYPDAADRCTVYPPDVDEYERMTHWLSADRDAFTALTTHR